MKIREFLKEYFQKRLERFGCLTVYDPEQRYRDLLMELDGGICRVIDGSRSTILAREEAMETWQRLGDPSGSLQSMLVYPPIPKPKTEVERQRIPTNHLPWGAESFPTVTGTRTRRSAGGPRPISSTRWISSLRRATPPVNIDGTSPHRGGVPARSGQPEYLGVEYQLFLLLVMRDLRSATLSLMAAKAMGASSGVAAKLTASAAWMPMDAPATMASWLAARKRKSQEYTSR